MNEIGLNSNQFTQLPLQVIRCAHAHYLMLSCGLMSIHGWIHYRIVNLPADLKPEWIIPRNEPRHRLALYFSLF